MQRHGLAVIGSTLLWMLAGGTGLAAIAQVAQAQVMPAPGDPPTALPVDPALGPHEAIPVPTVPTFDNWQPTTVPPALGDGIPIGAPPGTPPTASDWLVPTPLPVPGATPIGIAVPMEMAPPTDPTPPLDTQCQLAPGGAVYVCPPVATPAPPPPTTTSSADFPRPRALSFDFAPGFPLPTILPGSARESIVQTPTKSTGLAGIVRLAHPLSDSSNVALVVEGGEHIFALDAGFTQLNANHQGLGVNFAAQTSWSPTFRGGDREVDLPGGGDGLGATARGWVGNLLPTDGESQCGLWGELSTSFGATRRFWQRGCVQG